MISRTSKVNRLPQSSCIGSGAPKTTPSAAEADAYEVTTSVSHAAVDAQTGSYGSLSKLATPAQNCLPPFDHLAASTSSSSGQRFYYYPAVPPRRLAMENELLLKRGSLDEAEQQSLFKVVGNYLFKNRVEDAVKIYRDHTSGVTEQHAPALDFLRKLAATYTTCQSNKEKADIAKNSVDFFEHLEDTCWTGVQKQIGRLQKEGLRFFQNDKLSEARGLFQLVVAIAHAPGVYVQDVRPELAYASEDYPSKISLENKQQFYEILRSLNETAIKTSLESKEYDYLNDAIISIFQNSFQAASRCLEHLACRCDFDTKTIELFLGKANDSMDNGSYSDAFAYLEFLQAPGKWKSNLPAPNVVPTWFKLASRFASEGQFILLQRCLVSLKKNAEVVPEATVPDLVGKLVSETIRHLSGESLGPHTFTPNQVNQHRENAAKRCFKTIFPWAEAANVTVTQYRGLFETALLDFTRKSDFLAANLCSSFLREISVDAGLGAADKNATEPLTVSKLVQARDFYAANRFVANCPVKDLTRTRTAAQLASIFAEEASVFLAARDFSNAEKRLCDLVFNDLDIHLAGLSAANLWSRVILGYLEDKNLNAIELSFSNWSNLLWNKGRQPPDVTGPFKAKAKELIEASDAEAAERCLFLAQINADNTGKHCPNLINLWFLVLSEYLHHNEFTKIRRCLIKAQCHAESLGEQFVFDMGIIVEQTFKNIENGLFRAAGECFELMGVCASESAQSANNYAQMFYAAAAAFVSESRFTAAELCLNFLAFNALASDTDDTNGTDLWRIVDAANQSAGRALASHRHQAVKQSEDWSQGLADLCEHLQETVKTEKIS